MKRATHDNRYCGRDTCKRTTRHEVKGDTLVCTCGSIKLPRQALAKAS